MSERYYINLPLCPGPMTLDGPEAHHLATVCRLRAGDQVCLFNGEGKEYPARVTQVARRVISLEIVDVLSPERELPFLLEVAAPLPKGDRSQFLIEKLTEIGVKQFVPLACERSVIHPREGKLEKLERYVIEASKQCGRNVLMQIRAITPWSQYVKPGAEEELRLLAHPYQTEPLATLSQGLPALVRLAVGPEGGFTDAELALALEEEWKGVQLGPRILRIETAAIVLAARVSSLVPG